MTRGRSNKLVGQTGEYLVAAELSRRGLIATTFTGNVPHYDIIASDESGRNVAVQVKASRGRTWQFANISGFCDIEFSGKRQVVGKKKPCPIQRLVVVFVRIEPDRTDRFYILTWQDLRNIVIEHHKKYLAKHGGVRPKRWDSLHVGITETDLSVHQEQWEVVEQSLR